MKIYFFNCPSSKSLASLIFAARYGDPPAEETQITLTAQRNSILQIFVAFVFYETESHLGQDGLKSSVFCVPL